MNSAWIDVFCAFTARNREDSKDCPNQTIKTDYITVSLTTGVTIIHNNDHKPDECETVEDIQAINEQLHTLEIISESNMPSMVSDFQSSTGNMIESSDISTGGKNPKCFGKADNYDTFEFKCESSGGNCSEVDSDKDNHLGSSRHNTKTNEKLVLKEIKNDRYIRSYSAGPKGGILTLSEMGVCLYIPPNALSVEQNIFIGLSKNGSDIPDGSDGGHLYSPIFICGPHGLQFQKPVFLVFQHSLLLQGNPDKKSLPVFFRSETAINEESKWQPCENKIYLSRRLVMASICSFTKYVWRTIGDAAKCHYRVVNPMVFLEDIGSNDQSHGAKYDIVGVHIYIVDADDSEHKYAKDSARGKLVAQDTFFLNENLTTDISIQVIPCEHYSMISSTDPKIIELSDIQNNRIGLNNHVTFHLKKNDVEGAPLFNCAIRTTQTDGYSKTFEIVSQILHTSASRDSGFEEQGATGNTNKRQGMVQRNRDSVVSNTHTSSLPPSTTLASHVEVESHVKHVNSETELHPFLKKGTVQEFVLPPLVRNKLEMKMSKNAALKLAKFMEIIEPESWDNSTILHFFDITRQGVETKMALQELCSFFQSIHEDKLADVCEKF